MKKYFLFLVTGFLLSCSQQGEQVPYVEIDSTKYYLNTKPDSIINNETDAVSLESEITCPKCNFRKKEMMPDDYCVLKYICTNCKAEIYPDEKDCCVFCTYGTHKCPSKQ